MLRRNKRADDLYPTLVHALDVPGPSVVDVPIDYRESLRLTHRLGSLMRRDGSAGASPHHPGPGLGANP
ncbi:MAG TPA: hypothetical protein VFG94_14165 [Acidimicrobiales bacterium]|nr:hypothetical protein [Acidimicrobiales bacterium]